MPTYTVGIYDFDPYYSFSQSPGGSFTYNGQTEAPGTATITDTQGGGGSATLEDTSSGETATATVTVGGNTSNGVSVEAEEAWTVLDTTTGETFQVVTFRVAGGGAQGYYTLSEKPLVAGHTYETVSFTSEPSDAGGPVFTYADYAEGSADGTVEGTDGDDIIDGSYSDDPHGEVVDGGDSAPAPPEDLHLSWEGQGADEASVGGGLETDVGGIIVDVDFDNQSGSGSFLIESSSTQYVGGGEPFDNNSALELRSSGGAGDVSTTTIDFSAAGGSGFNDEVENLQFRVNDIDTGSWRDVVEVRAFDADGNPVDVNITISGNETESGGVVTAGNGSEGTGDAAGSVLFEIPGPVKYIEIDYGNAATGGQAVYVTDLHFQAITPGADEDVIEAGAGDDSIDAGLDSDTVFGGSGDDTIAASHGDDSLFGGDDADTFVLSDGQGSDSITGGEGGTDRDVIDASAVTQGVTVTFTGAEAGTLSDGTDTASFSEIEGLTLTDQADTVQGGASTADMTIDAGAGDDSVTGGAGQDSIALGAGDDTALVGEGDSVSGGAGDDTFVIADTAGTGTITITGGEGDETGGDTLDFNGLLDRGSVVITDDDDANGGLTGYAFLQDGTRVEFSQIESIICFAQGTGILGEAGETRVEQLAAGDRVVTLDHGLQRIRWIGSRVVPAQGDLAPIVIARGTLGNHRDLLVSPQHRMLIRGPMAELLFQESEVLVPAKHLLHWDGVWRREGGTVRYFHMLFDRHEIVHAEGALAESFHPGEAALDSMSRSARDEILALFPQLEQGTAAYGPAARASLRSFEAGLLRAEWMTPAGPRGAG